MDEIRISDLVVFANHGVFQEEAVLGQKFLVSAVIETDIRKPGRSDSLDNTINYGEVSQEITRFLTENRFQLIEACAEQLAEYLLLKYETLMKRITLEIKKPWAPVRLPLDTVSVKITRGWHTVYIALGSNMGDKDAYLEFGVEELKKLPQIRIDQVSSFIRTEPYGYTDQDVFLNGACKVRTTFTPEELLDEMQRIELEAKRVRKIHWDHVHWIWICCFMIRKSLLQNV